ncbi:MAG: CBS domain-containing protein [Actinomycetota bacterium]
MSTLGVPVSSLASRHVISIEPTAPLRTIIGQFVERGVGFVVVLDSGSVAGVVSEHDVLSALHDGADIDTIWAADIMSLDLVTANGGDSIAEVARLMIDARVRHVLVVGEDGGVVSIRDVLDALVASSAAGGGSQTCDEDALAASAAAAVFHLRAAIELTAANRPAEAVAETVLVLALLVHQGMLDPTSPADLPAPAPLTPAKREDVARVTRALARQLQAHYLNEGQHALAELYESAASAVDSVLIDTR